MARRARLLLAEMRAMEEQGERENPTNPKKQLEGMGSVPSMGLSQFRGGRTRMTKKEKEMKEESEEEMSESGTDEEAMSAGAMFGRTLTKLHGAGYLKAFHKGMGGGAQTGAYEGEGLSGGAIRHNFPQAIGTVNDDSMDGFTGAARVVGAGKKRRAGAGAGDKRKERGAMISKLMKKHHCTLAEASRMLKNESAK